MKNEYSEQEVIHYFRQVFKKGIHDMHRITKLSLVLILFLSGCSAQLAEKSDSLSGSSYRMLRAASPASADTADKNALLDVQAAGLIETPELDPAQQGRLVVYNAVINVVVERISDSINSIEKTVVEMGGYMQEMTSNSITLKVPADKFQRAIAEVEKLGDVTKRDIKGTDVTEEMRDLNIRLKNAEEARDKMMSLLEKAESVEDALKIEKELERITETVELLKGKISYLQNKVNYSTLTVQFNSPIPQEDFILATPFFWVQMLGSELSRPVSSTTSKSNFFFGLFNWSKFTLPDGYIKYYENNGKTRAMSADGVMIYLHKEKNYKGGNVDFWSSLVRRVLVEQKTIHPKKESEIKLKNKKDAFLFVGSKQVGSKQYGYIAAVAPAKNDIYIIEAWGPSQEFEKDENKLEKAVMSLKF